MERREGYELTETIRDSVSCFGIDLPLQGDMYVRHGNQ